MDFGWALNVLGHGDRVCRSGWNGKGMYLFMVTGWEITNPDGSPELEKYPFIAMKTADNKLVPWLASQTDVLANDWDYPEE